MLGRLLKEHLLLSVLFLVLFFGAGVPSAGAQQVSCNEGDPNCVCTLVPVGPIEGGRTRVLCTSTNSDGTTTTSVTNPNTGGNTTATTSADGQTIEQTTTAPESSGKCGLGNIGQCFLNLPGLLFSGLAFLLLTLSSLILGIAGVVFNWVVIRTVFQFALYFGTSPGMIVAWGVLRDISNIALLFAFIFMGIATILNTQAVEGYTAKKALPSLIIFAVLLNFSLFATQGVIDVANGFSSVFSSYAGEQCSTATSGVGENGQTNADCANIGISSKILEAAGMHQIIPSGEQAVSAFSHAWDQPYTYSVMLIILSIMVTVTAMVLFAASIMLIIRVVVLSLLMVTSPIGFAGMAIPALHGIAKDWWHKLINQAFFAPVYLLLIFISIKLVDTLQDGQATVSDAIMGNTAAAGATTAGNMQVVVVFMVVIGFMIAALMVAQKMGAYGASFATKSAAGLSFGVHGFVARRTVGRLSNNLANKVLANSSFRAKAPGLARLTYGALNKGATASFSSRNAVGGALKGATGLDFGTANKTAAHGFHGIEEKLVKDRVDFSKKIKPSAEQAGAGKELQVEFEELDKKINNELTPLRQDIVETQKRVAEARKNGSQAEIESARTSLKESLSAYSNKESELKNENYNELKTLATGWRKKAEKEASDEYVQGLNDAAHNANFVQKYGTMGPLADHHAAEQIVKDAGKSKIEKALKDIQDATEKGDAGGGGGGHAPIPKPSGGGAAPAAGGHH